MCIFHDWEVLAREIDEYGDPFWVTKVCLKCGKIVDEIKERKERQKKARELRAKRQDLAKRIYRGEVKIK
jgi:hypothetical protein